MLKKRVKTRKTCPRCKSVCDINATKCPDCNLNFDKLEYASNKLAKRNFWAKKQDEIIKMPKYPKDVSKPKTILLCIFLGFFGAHNFYLGRYYKAFIQLIVGIIAFTLVAVASATSALYNTLVNIAAPFVGVFAIWWLLDIVAVSFGYYQIPISIDTSLMPQADYSKKKN